MNNVRAEHLLDEVSDQCIVQSDLNIHHEVDSDMPMSVNKERIEDNQELYPLTPIDLNVHHIVHSGIGKFFEVYS